MKLTVFVKARCRLVTFLTQLVRLSEFLKSPEEVHIITSVDVI